MNAKQRKERKKDMKAVARDDILRYRFLSELRAAPDGKRAAFVVSEANAEENNYESRLWLYENGEVRQLTDLGQERGFAWLDDELLVFPACRSAKEKKRREAGESFTSYYLLDLHGGEARHFFTLPFAAGAVRVLDKTHFAVSASVDKSRPELWDATAEEKEKARKEQKEEKDYEVFDEKPFWFNGAGVRNGQRNTLFLVSLEPLTITALTSPPEECGSLAVLGDELFYTVSSWNVKMPMFGCELRAVNWKTGEKRSVCQEDGLSVSSVEAVGEEIWLFGTTGERYGLNENNWVWRVDPKTGERTLLRKEEYSLYNSVGSDCRLGGCRSMAAHGGMLYHLTTREGNCHLYRMSRDGSDEPVLTYPGSVEGFAFLNDAILLIGLFDMRLQELYTLRTETGELKRVSSFNESVMEEVYVAEPEAIEIESAGLKIGGWILKPKDYDPSRHYPAILDVHGGPKTVYGPVFYHEMQLWAGMGYFVFFCNPKGSDGRDNAFMDIRGEYGVTDYQNLMDFTDAVLARYPQIDPNRVCETGGSYGGFMTNWIIGHTDRFCCAASQRSISNWISFCGTSDIGYDFASDQNAAELFSAPEKLWERSPLKYAGNVKTPTLFIHADEDYRCPLEQGLQMYSALAEREVPTRLCLFHGENHELSRSGKPQHRLRRLKEITDWFETYSKEK